MGTAVSLGSCLFGTMCHCLCSACSICGASPKVYSRIGYVLFAFVWIVLSAIFLFYGHYIFYAPFSDYIDCKEENREICVGISAVYRTSFTLCVFHMLLCLLCTCKGQLISKINEGAWPVKFIFVLIIFILSFFMSNNFFKGYGYVAMVGSFFFLVYEMILIIDMAYTWNSAWVGNYDSSQGGCSSACWGTTLIIGTVIAAGCGLTAYVMLFINSANTTADYFVIGLPIAAAVVYTTLTVIQIVEGASIFTCALVFFFGSFLTVSIELAHPEKSSAGLLVLQIVIGLGFLFFVLFYVGARTEKPAAASSEETSAAQQTTNKVVDAVAEKADDGSGGEVLTSRESGEEPAQPVSEKTCLFHLLMAFASLYYSMVLSNWGSPKIGNGVPLKGFSNPWLGYGVMLAAQWIGILFFIWSLIAPRICPNRDFQV